MDECLFETDIGPASPNNASADVVLVKMISRFNPAYLGVYSAIPKRYRDESLGQEILSIDIAWRFWQFALNEARLAHEYRQPDGDLRGRLRAEIDHSAIAALPAAKEIVSRIAQTMPSAAELIFAYRVIERSLACGAMAWLGVSATLGRGVTITEYDQYDLNEIFARLEGHTPSAAHEFLLQFFDAHAIRARRGVFIFNLRNDMDLVQALLYGRAIKRLYSQSAVVLELAGANEQYNFTTWMPLLRRNSLRVSESIDYLIPQQDYKATLRCILPLLIENSSANMSALPNLVRFTPPRAGARVHELAPESLDEAFTRSTRSSPVFLSAGLRTMLARVSPTRCHWSACSFCTINSQHPLPRGRRELDDQSKGHIATVIETAKDKGVGSLILMDEALHPNFLVGFARAVLESGVEILYRARARFTNDLDAGACRLLYASGCRYLGMGLESATPRVNTLVNKDSGEPIDYRRILADLEAAGVRPHIYAIMGFPTETQEEIEATRDFLISCIEHSRYVTVSPNRFYLMRGSTMAAKPERFGMELSARRRADGAEIEDLALVLDFSEPIHARNVDATTAAVRAVHRAQFLPGIEDEAFAEGFWHFVDQTGIFYQQKVLFRDNPYRALARERWLDRSRAGDAPEQSRFEPSFLFVLQDPFDTDTMLLCDWVTNNYARVPRCFEGLLTGYRRDWLLCENVAAHVDPVLHDDAVAAFCRLVEAGFFERSTPLGQKAAGDALEATAWRMMIN